MLPVAVLGAVVVGVLVAGALAPRASSLAAPVNPRAERTVPTRLAIRPDLEKTPLAYQADYWEQLGEQAITHLVQVGPYRVPGVVVEPGLVLTSSTAVEPQAPPPPPMSPESPAAEGTDPSRVPTADTTATDVDPEGPSAESDDPGAGSMAGNRPGGPGLIAVDWDDGLALYELGDPATAPAFRPAPPDSFHAGSFAVAVTRTSEGGIQLTPGHITEVSAGEDDGGLPDSMQVSLALAAETAAAAVVDLDGDLLGVAIRANGGVRTLAGNELAMTVARLKPGPACYPIETSDLTEELLALLNLANGVAVERIRESAFRGDATLEPGDVLVEWNGQPVSSVDQFLELYRTHPVGERVPHVVVRDARRVRGSSVVPDRHCRPLPEDDAALLLTTIGVTLVPADPRDAAAGVAAWTAIHVIPESPAATGGLLPGDRVVAVNGRPLLERNARRTLERLDDSERAIVFSVRREGRVKLLAVTPPDA